MYVRELIICISLFRYATGFKLGETKFRFIRAVEGEQIIGRSVSEKFLLPVVFGVVNSLDVISYMPPLKIELES